ncbi:polysaccharide biosynthesis protein [Natronococcus amylolyticus DSM 10524]|uniref:Polysaccharide biosynthesis protein n=2 Tax=Natronococcus amylolyticus TaxID=44470 RepID=L9WZW7_9EURY|nr:polysaccharide biosynthesis protein [Natronococcus amylolyticus DSM 10524]
MSRSFVSGFLYVLTSKFGTLILSVLITPIIIRLLGSENYGNYAFVLSVITVLSLITSPGVSTGLRKYIAENRDYSNWESLVFAFYFRVGIVLVTIASVSTIFLLYTGLVDPLIGSDVILYLYLGVVILIVRQLFSINKNALRGLNREKYSDPLLILRKAMFGGVSVALIYVGWGVWGVLVGEILAVLLASIIAIFFLRRDLDLSYVAKLTPSNFPRRDLLSYNFSNMLFMAMLGSLYQFDILLMNPLAGSEQTGYYKGALVIAEFLWFVPLAVQTMLVHSTSELWLNGKTEKISSIASKVTRYTILFTSLLAIGLISLVDDFVPLYLGQDFSNSIKPLLLLIPGAIGLAAARPILSIGQAKGNMRLLILATGFATFLNISLNIYLIPRYGMNGAAIATSISYGSMFFFHLFSAHRLGFYPLKDLRLSRILGTVILTAVPLLLLSNLIDSTVASLVFIPPIGFCIYSFSAIKLNAISIDEINRILDGCPDPLRRYGRIFLQKLES